MSNETYPNIFRAAEHGTVDDVKHFIENENVDVNAKNHHWGRTPLHFAAVENGVEVLQYLISQGADVHATDCSCYTPLHEAAWYNSNLAVIQYLIAQGADVNAQCGYGDTPLHKAAERNTLEIIQYLISQGAEFDATDLLFHAIGCNSLEVVQYIVSLGADVQVKDCEGDTLLHGAAQSNENVEVLEYFISQGIDVQVKNDEGKTPLDVANSEAKKHILQEAILGNPKFGIVPKNREVLEKEWRRLRGKKGNYHNLEGNREGQLACALEGAWRLVFVPNHDPIPVDADGKLDWSKVTAVEIQEIVDYHTDTDKTSEPQS